MTELECIIAELQPVIAHTNSNGSASDIIMWKSATDLASFLDKNKEFMSECKSSIGKKKKIIVRVLKKNKLKRQHWALARIQGILLLERLR